MSKIIYNLKERGREYTGEKRNFNIEALCDTINGSACQERVKNRDMLGYYGHWARMRFGITPSEGGIDKGVAIPVEPAIVTTFLKASLDGTVEHISEFLDTTCGALAKKLNDCRAGGFSSVIKTTEDNPQFYGFDYVLSPNFTENRGYTLDDTSEQQEIVDGFLILLKESEDKLTTTSLALDSLTEENTEYLSMLSNQNRNQGFQRPNLVAIDSADMFIAENESFKKANLPAFERDINKESLNEYADLLRRFKR